MLDHHQLKIIADARLLAIEFMLTRAFVRAHRDLPDNEFADMMSTYLLDLDLASIPGVDAATSDAMAAETRDSVQHLLNTAKSVRDDPKET